MTKTYIYGVPHGFDFYEKDASLNEYFKGFYISSRRGRRLMINRRDNGDTIYSYLRYGLKEVSRQPLHSFFGMSLVVDNYQYCPKFKVLLEWFDYLFNKLVNEHNIIKKNEDGVLYYVVHKFEENSIDVEWLKSNLPNILSQAGQAEIIGYDNSFADGKAGQVVSFNQPVGENRLLETFKKYRWLSVSSEITEKEVSGVSGSFTDPGTIELNYEELNKKLNELNQQLLPIAVDISKGSYSDLKQMFDNVQEINTSLTKYLPTIDDVEEKEKFNVLEGKYDSLKASIGKLLEKFTPSSGGGTTQPPKPETQYCFSCKQNKPLSHFSSPNATKCKDCEEQELRRKGLGGGGQAFKICVSCGKKKHVRFFNKQGTDICDECARGQKPKAPGPESPFDKTGKFLTSKGFLGALASIAVIAVIAFAVMNLPDSCSTGDIILSRSESETTRTSEVAETRNKVDRAELEKLKSANDFKAIYEYIADKSDAGDYKRPLKEAVNNFLWSIVDSSPVPQEDLQTFYITNNEFLDFIGFGDDDKQAWTEIVNDYTMLWEILKKPNVKDTDLEVGYEILAKHSGLFPAEFSQALAEKPREIIRQGQVAKKEDKQNKGDTTVGNTATTFTLTYTQASNGKEVTINIDGSKIGFDGLVGSYATVNCKNGKIKENGKNSCRIHLTETKKYKVNLDGKIVLTITAKTSKFNE